jgi:hypothetical protein
MLMTHNLSFRCHADMTTKGWESAKVEILPTAFVKVETDVITNISTSLRASCDISDLQNWCYCFYQYVFDVTLTDYFQYYSQFVDTCWLIIFSIIVSLLILADWLFSVLQSVCWYLLTDYFQYYSQFVDTCNITLWDHRENVKITDKS